MLVIFGFGGLMVRSYMVQNENPINYKWNSFVCEKLSPKLSLSLPGNPKSVTGHADNDEIYYLERNRLQVYISRFKHLSEAGVVTERLKKPDINAILKKGSNATNIKQRYESNDVPGHTGYLSIINYDLDNYKMEAKFLGIIDNEKQVSNIIIIYSSEDEESAKAAQKIIESVKFIE